MSDKEFINNLSSTYADMRRLDTKKINLKGKNILDYIKEAEFDSYDTRDPQLKNDELDIWNTEISLSDNGYIEVKPFEHTYEEMTDAQKELLLNSAATVVNNEVLDENGNHLMYWLTDGLTDTWYRADKDNNGRNDADLSIFCNYAYSGDQLSNLSLTSFSSDLSSVTDGYQMFYGCANLAEFSSDLSNLTNGYSMFDSCTALTSFSQDLSSLTEGEGMFYGCNNIATFTSDLPSLITGSYMFYECTALTTFTSDVSSLENGSLMFDSCSNLSLFNSDLSKMTHSRGMFLSCVNLTSFTSSLSSLINGRDMFSLCKLDAKSVSNIVHTLPTHESNGLIAIGIGCDNTEEDKLLFAQECHCDTWQELLDEFSAKNWTVTFQCNGRPTATYNMRIRRETLPVFVKIDEVIMPEEEDKKRHKPYYSHTSLDGSKFYQLTHFHSTNGSTEGYTLFNSIEEAEQNFEITPKQ